MLLQVFITKTTCVITANTSRGLEVSDGLGGGGGGGAIAQPDKNFLVTLCRLNILSSVFSVVAMATSIIPFTLLNLVVFVSCGAFYELLC